MLLLNYSEMTPSQVVGTDLLFGLVLAVIGSALHWTFGSVNVPILFEFLVGGVPRVVLGCLPAPRIPAQRIKVAVAMVAILAGLPLVWTGGRSVAQRHLASVGRPARTESSSWKAPQSNIVIRRDY